MPSAPSMYTSLVLFLLFLYLIFLYCKNLRERKRYVPFNWPVLGMIPALLWNTRRIHHFITEVLEANGGTFLFKGPSFANLDMLITADPANVHYILTKNFHNFPKGPEFKKIFDILGEGIFTADAESWENQRKAAKSFMNNASFQQFSARTAWTKVLTGLVPMLESAAETGEIVDIQELFQRLAFDCTCLVVLGHDPGSLSEELPHIPPEKAFGDAEEALLYRHVVPEFIWQLQKWLHIGTEKKLSMAKETLHRFLSKCIFETREQNEDSHDILSCYNRAIRAKSDALNIPQEMWKDASLSLLSAGKDTISAALTWFFWLIATNPEQEEKIREEIAANSGGDRGTTWSFSGVEELKKFVYLHGALCETLRLFPPVGLQHKAPLVADVLPSGHRVERDTKTVLSFFSMGRMKSIWGKDCLDFKPERWISGNGTTRIEPSFKFTAFNAGPRSCIGKDMSFIQLKIIAAAVLCRFTIRVAEGHPVEPKTSVILHVKDGLKVKVAKLREKMDIEK